MTTKSLYLILCVAASLTLLAFTQKTISGDGQAVASSTSVNGQPAVLQRPTTSTGNIDRGTSTGATTGGTTNSTNSTTSTNSSTSMDYPTTTTNGTTGPVTSPNPNPNVTTSSGNTTTMDIPIQGSTTSPNE